MQCGHHASQEQRCNVSLKIQSQHYHRTTISTSIQLQSHLHVHHSTCKETVVDGHMLWLRHSHRAAPHPVKIVTTNSLTLRQSLPADLLVVNAQRLQRSTAATMESSLSVLMNNITETYRRSKTSIFDTKSYVVDGDSSKRERSLRGCPL